MRPPAVQFPDAVAVVIDGLLPGFVAESLASVPIVNQVPGIDEVRPDEFLTVRRLGGPRRDLVTDQAQLALEAWAPTYAAAMDLAQVGRALLFALAGTKVGDVTVYRITEISGPAELPDPISTQPRVAWSALVALRGGALNP